MFSLNLLLQLYFIRASLALHRLSIILNLYPLTVGHFLTIHNMLHRVFAQLCTDPAVLRNMAKTVANVWQRRSYIPIKY